MSIGQNIKNKRELLNISQTDLANRVGISKQTLYKYENDIVSNIPLNVIEKIAYYLECSPAYITGWNDNQMSSELDAVIDRLNEIEKEKVLSYANFLFAQRSNESDNITHQ